MVPLLVQGDRTLSIYHVDQIRGFLGLPAPEHATTSYQEYVAALDRVLEAVERAVRQVPPEHLESPTPNRGRDLKELTYNIHEPITFMADSLDTRAFVWHADDFVRSRQFTTSEQLAAFCHQTRQAWLARAAAVEQTEADAVVSSERGDLTNFQILEFQAVHAGRHLRQIYVFLREIGVEPTQELTAMQMAPINIGDVVF